LIYYLWKKFSAICLKREKSDGGDKIKRKI